MIKKAFLPMGLGNSKVEQSLANHVAQRLNPTGQGNPIYWKGCKEMHVVGHYDVTTNGNIMLQRLGRENAKCLMNLISCQQPLTFVCVECDEVKRPNIVKQPTESWRSPRPLFSVLRRHG